MSMNTASSQCLPHLSLPVDVRAKRLRHLAWIVLLMLLVLSMSGCSIFKSSSSGGGYYQNDGPGDPSQLDPDKLQDAVPRVEPLMSGPNKPYTVLGQRYVPDTREIPFTQRGMASWYGKQFHGRPTSSGEKYNMYEMTAAHTTLPIPCYVRVTNVANGRSVIVRVNDRGPFHQSRIIDLSYAAAYKLGYVNKGTAEVIVERIMPSDIAAGRVSSSGSSTSGSTVSSGASSDVLAGGYFVQIGAYGSQTSAQSLVSRLGSQDRSIGSNLRVTHDGRYYRVYAGPYRTSTEAQVAARAVETLVGVQPLVLNRP